MVSSVEHYSSGRNRAFPGEGFDGVVRIAVGGYYGTGVLLFDGRAVLTAAHIFGNGVQQASVFFDVPGGVQSFQSRAVSMHPLYQPSEGNHDLALLWLPGAPLAAARHALYRESDETGKIFSFAGYGVPGTGSRGLEEGYTGTPVRLQASNRFDADAGELKYSLGDWMGWSPAPGTQLVADFDDGSLEHDALGRLLGIRDPGLGLQEGLITPGDSGGPAFIEGAVAGIASYVASLGRGSTLPDPDDVLNSSFGEIAAWQRVSHYQQWIDQSLRAWHAAAPKSAAEVRKSVVEGDQGTTFAYFFLEFTGVRSDPWQWLSVDYATRDGTAKAGEDYVGTQGRLILYPGEVTGFIAVEIIGDTTPEPDEYFYLDVFNPVGGSFGEGVVRLTAQRTIMDDDGWWI